MNIKEILKWFKKAVPEPTVEAACVQIGCHYEEVAEMIDALRGNDFVDMNFMANEYKHKSDTVIKFLNHVNNIDSKLTRNDLLDSLCDQIVTAIGVAHMLGFDIENALDEVNRSNWSKFENGEPLFDENGKIKKGKSYFKPDLSKFV